jgi:hypothetical protein
MSLNLKTLLLTTATVACSWAGVMTGAKAESPPGMKLYVFSSGFLNIDKSALQAGGRHRARSISPLGFSSSITRREMSYSTPGTMTASSATRPTGGRWQPC